MKEKLVSIIMPVHNSELYLKNSIESVLQQTYTSFELIIIDDNSTDNSKEIIKNYSKIDKRIKTIFLNIQSGPSKARNAGLDVASGYFLMFIDSDDEFSSKDSVRLAIESMDNENEMLIFSYLKCYLENNVKEKYFSYKNESKFYESKVPLLVDFVKFKYSYSNWNKVYLFSIIKDNNIRFCENVYMGEDKLFNICYLFYTKNIRTSDEPLYCYKIHSDSLFSMKQNKKKLKFNDIEYCKYITKFIYKQNIDEKEKAILLNSILFTNSFRIKASENFKKIRNYAFESKQIRNLCKYYLRESLLYKDDLSFAKAYYSPLYRYSIYLLKNFSLILKTKIIRKQP